VEEVVKTLRKITHIFESKPTVEGAGVHLKRVFGYHEVPILDPFLLLDDFHSENPDHYRAGFPWHPHRGIETVTYMIHGRMKHEDSIGNSGVIQDGDVQWMTAGSGIIHSEIPDQDRGLLWGFQLWVNLPSTHKMMDPRYQDIKNDQIPEALLSHNVRIRVICGEVDGVRGPVQDIVVDTQYLEITVPPNTEFVRLVQDEYTMFAYVIDGKAHFNQERDRLINPEHLLIFKEGNAVKITTEDKHVKFLLISGKPIGEPVAWTGPIVMNTREEIQMAFEEYRNGTFIKNR
jgi:redox-sensitive bicupin YhaK (pirin superfamily)